MVNLFELEKEIKQIKQRNKHVETDKAWETSLSRKTLLAIFTYLAIGLYLNVIAIEAPWLNAIVPTIAFLLSTLTIPFFKELWKNKIYKKF